MSQVKVRGYMKPASAFHTLAEWEHAVEHLLHLQELGMDSRGGQLSCKHHSSCSLADFDDFLDLVNKYFDYQLVDEVERWKLLTQKNVLDFIEDFVNHRFWAFEKEYGSYFPDIARLKFAYFYSRGDMEPYVMLDDEFTSQVYGGVYNPKVLNHYTTESGAQRLVDSIGQGEQYDISSFTVMERPFFRPESIVLVKFVGNVRAGFRSDIKSMALDNGRRACNMHRLGYPGRGIDNLCYELDSCDSTVETSLWNEYIATPLEIISVDPRL